MSAIADDPELNNLIDQLLDKDKPTPAIQAPQAEPVESPEPIPLPVPAPPAPMSIPDPSDSDLNATFNQLMKEVADNYRADRTKITEFIDLLRGKIDGDETPVRIYYESLAATLRTQAETSVTMIKLMENINKRLSKDGGGAISLQELIDG